MRLIGLFPLHSRKILLRLKLRELFDFGELQREKLAGHCAKSVPHQVSFAEIFPLRTQDRSKHQLEVARHRRSEAQGRISVWSARQGLTDLS